MQTSETSTQFSHHPVTLRSGRQRTSLQSVPTRSPEHRPNLAGYLHSSDTSDHRVITFPGEEAHEITKLHDLFPQIHRCSLDCWYLLQTNRLLYPWLQENEFLCGLPSLQILVVTFLRLIFHSAESHLLRLRCLKVFILRITTPLMPLMVMRSAHWLYLISYLFTANV